jgi:hypothetical protein
MQASRNFSEEWVNMRKMFVNDEFKDISAAQGVGGPLKKVLSLWNAAVVASAHRTTAWGTHRTVQMSRFLGKFFVKGFRAADNALVNAHALESVDLLEGTHHMTPEQVRTTTTSVCASPLSVQMQQHGSHE